MQNNDVIDTNAKLPIFIDGKQETALDEDNLLYLLESKDGSEYRRGPGGNLIKVRDGKRRLNSSKVNKKKNK